MKIRRSWPAYALFFTSAGATADVVYDVSVRSVDQNFALAAPSGIDTPVVSQYFVEAGSVRVGGPRAKTVRVFKDRTLYVIDNASRSVHILKHSTLNEISAHHDAALKQLEEAAANAAPGDRAQAERRVADMKGASDRLRQTVAREYRMTVRFESVDGHACRVWEERESDAKRLEICVAPAAALPGGADVIEGIKTLSRFRQGAKFALGVDFGLSEWWSDIASLNGVPLLVREFKYDSLVSEFTLSAIHPGAIDPALFDAPEGYQTQDGPDYAD